MTDPSTEKRSTTTTTTKHPPTPAPQALVFDPANPDQVTEEPATEQNKAKNNFEVRLPRWSNRFAVFEEPQKKFGYMFTLRLDRLGWVKNWKRRLGGEEYRVLHVKDRESGKREEGGGQ